MRDTLLFDLDGTLTDTDALHFEAYRRLLAPLGKTITHDDYRHRIMGAANEAIMSWLFPGEPQQRHLALAEEKESLFRAQLATIVPTPGLPALLSWATQHGIRTAVVTNAPRANAEAMLGALGLLQRFETLVIGDELARGKPDPLPYRTALDRLGRKAEHALAFEDSRSGVQSASRAGIPTIGMTTGLDETTLRAAGAIAAIADFRDPWLGARLASDYGSAPSFSVP
jgi:beta-phosphoglucomutase